MIKFHSKKAKTGQKQGSILGIKITSTSRDQVLNLINSRLENKEKFYIVTPNPEIVLKAKDDWLLKKSIMRSDFSIPDGIGLKFAYKYLYNKDLEIIKGRELFLDIIKIADELKLRVCFVGGDNDEAEKTKFKLLQTYKNIVIQAYKTPKYGKNGQPASIDDRRMHKSLLGKIKMFEPDFIFVGMTTPKQEKWIYRNFFRLNATGAMAIGGTYNFMSGNLSLPPKWLESLGLEWLWRLITEPSRIKRIFNAVILFPIEVLIYKPSRK